MGDQSQNTPNNNLNAPNLDNVEGGYAEYLGKRWWLIILLLIVSGAVIYVSPPYGIVIFIIGISAMKYFYENALFKAFAVTNNFSYQKKGSLDNQTGLLFNIGHGTKFHDIVIGTYKNWPFKLFMYVYTIGYGRGSHTYHRAVMSIDFNTSSPTFVLRHHRVIQLFEEEGESLKSNNYTQEVNLEGDFSKHLKVYIKPGTQDEVLSILTPDVMQMLIGLDKYELELTAAGVLYIYSHDYITKKQDLIDIYSIIEAVSPKIATDVYRKETLQNIVQQNSAPAVTT
jgi:hypothetical protein